MVSDTRDAFPWVIETLFIYLLCFASKHHTIIALKKLGHHNSLTPITVGPKLLQLHYIHGKVGQWFGSINLQDPLQVCICNMSVQSDLYKQFI